MQLSQQLSTKKLTPVSSVVAQDTIAFVIASANNVTVKGGAGDDTLNLLVSAQSDAALINGGDGNDNIKASGIASSTSVYGASGADPIVFSGTSDNGKNLRRWCRQRHHLLPVS